MTNNECVVVHCLVAKCCCWQHGNWNGCQKNKGGRRILAHQINNNDKWQQMSPFTVFAHHHVHHFSSLLSCLLSVVVVVHLHHHVCHPSASSCLLVLCASWLWLPLCGVLTMVVLHRGGGCVMLVVVVLWCWSVVITLWLWGPLDK